MTTPNITSPNVRIVPKEIPLGADAPKSQTPLAEAALAELLQGGRLGIRDMYKPVPLLPEIVTEEARGEWDALVQDVSDKAESARVLLGDWWRTAWAETFQKPPFWAGTPALPDPEAHPYPVPAPVAEPVPEPAADEAPATDATAVLLADAEEAAEEPDAAQVIVLDKAETEAMPKLDADGGQQ
jgi:hypothetical protein